ncbi:MAG: hypothetical protein NNA24_09610 [Nitrospira sp.]|nr:hypothetical protein [Nitrospira sp.]
MQEWTTLERLTEAAHTAALKGEWNVVEACYREREAVLQEAEMSDAVRERLLALDREVAERVRTAKAGISALLQDVGSRRKRLEHLRQRMGGSPEPSTLIDRQG